MLKNNYLHLNAEKYSLVIDSKFRLDNKLKTTMRVSIKLSSDNDATTVMFPRNFNDLFYCLQKA